MGSTMALACVRDDRHGTAARGRSFSRNFHVRGRQSNGAVDSKRRVASNYHQLSVWLRRRNDCVVGCRKSQRSAYQSGGHFWILDDEENGWQDCGQLCAGTVSRCFSGLSTAASLG